MNHLKVFFLRMSFSAQRFSVLLLLSICLISLGQEEELGQVDIDEFDHNTARDEDGELFPWADLERTTLSVPRVTNGAVKVNGEVVYDLGRQVDVENDAISFRGKLLSFDSYVYFVLFKPEGYITTASDPKAKKTVYDLLPKKLVSKTKQQGAKRVRVFPVGRLDKDSCGLLLFTNDGDFSNTLTHPRYGVSKWYEVRLDRPLEFSHRKQLLDGVRLYDGKAKAQKLYHVSKRKVRIMIPNTKHVLNRFRQNIVV